MPEIQSLTALRGVAALWVVLFHYRNHFVWVPMAEIIRQGSVAVDIFFTLSGFILVYVYRDEFNVANFWLKRFARLYPVHLVALIAVTILTAGAQTLGMSVDNSISAKEFIIHLFTLHSFALMDGLALNYPSWSISAEFSAYLVFPFIVAFVLRQRLMIVGPILLLFFLACVLVAKMTGNPMTERSYDFAPLRIMPEFLLGMLSARLCLQGQLKGFASALIAAALLIFGLANENPLAIIISAPFLIAALFLYDHKVPAPLHYLGLISYSLYMVHALVEKVGFTLFEVLVGQTVIPIWVLPIMIAAVISAASMLYHFVEVPGRHFVMSVSQRMTQKFLKSS